jgi:hypothetical protein
MTRPNLGFGADNDQEQSSATPQTPIVDFAPKARNNDLSSVRESAAKNAAEQGFSSREPQTQSVNAASTATRDRRKKTGRAQNFTTRVSPEFHQRFYAIVDGKELSVCEAFERAVMALEREFDQASQIFTSDE